MSDIKYTWAKGKGSIGLDEKLSLPQFAVAGHRQLQKVIPLSTGKKYTFYSLYFFVFTIFLRIYCTLSFP